MVTKADFIKFLLSLKEVLPKYAPEFKEQRAYDLWFDAFEHLEMSDLKEIYTHCRSNLDEFPSIRKMLSIVAEAKGDEPRDPFSEILLNVQRHGSNRSSWPNLHPAISELVRQLGGPGAIGEWHVDYYDQKRKLIDKLWPDILARHRMGQLDDKTALPSESKNEVKRLIDRLNQ